MNAIVDITNQEPTTTSLIIADGVGNAHASVIRLIRDNAKDFEEFGPLGFEIHVVNRPQGGGSKKEYAVLNEQQATLLMTYMRNNDVVRKFKKTLVKEFYEAKQAQPPKSFAEALRLAADKQEEIERLECKVLEFKPKAEFCDRVSVSEDAISVAQAAKVIGTGRNRLMSFMRKDRWINRNNEPYQFMIECGYLDVKLGSFQHPDQGLVKTVTTLITGKGLVKLQKAYADDGC